LDSFKTKAKIKGSWCNYNLCCFGFCCVLWKQSGTRSGCQHRQC